MSQQGYTLVFRNQIFGYPGGTINCVGANFFSVFLTPAHVAAGVTIDGAPCFAGNNEFKCPTPEGRINNLMEIKIPSGIVPKLTVKIGFITFENSNK